MPKVIIPQQYQKLAADNNEYNTANTHLSDVFAECAATYPQLVGSLLNEQYQPQPFISVFVDGEQVDDHDIDNTQLAPDTEVLFVNAVAGG